MERVRFIGRCRVQTTGRANASELYPDEPSRASRSFGGCPVGNKVANATSTDHIQAVPRAVTIRSGIPPCFPKCRRFLVPDEEVAQLRRSGSRRTRGICIDRRSRQEKWPVG